MARILFVDDEPAIRETFPRILAMGGHTVVSAATVGEALAHITSEHFDLLISDLNVGHPADGFVVVSAMKRTHPECVTFILTGYPGFESALQAIREQVDEYLIKPADLGKLLKTIDEKLSRRKSHQISGYKRLSALLRENIPVIVERARAAMKPGSEQQGEAIAAGSGIAGVADALREVADLMDEGGPAELEAGRPNPMDPLQRIVQEKRIIGQVLSQLFHENLLSLDLSHMMPDMAQLNNALFWQLRESVRAYVEAHPAEVWGQGRAERGVAERVAEFRGVDLQAGGSKAVHTSVEQFEAILDSAMDAIVSVDAQQNVVLFNRAAEQMFGCPVAEAIGKPLDRFLPEDLREAHRHHVANFGETGETIRSMHSPAMLNALRSNGKQFPVEATISQTGEGDQRRYTVILRDITQRKRTERAVLVSEKLASLGRLSAAVAHEINNPLEALKNLVYLIMSNPFDTEMVREYAELADVEVNHIAEITRRVLGVSRSGDTQSRFSPAEVFETVLMLEHRKIQEKAAVLKKEYRQDVQVWGTASEIRQVFSSLLVNGLDAIPRGGLIRVRVSGCHSPSDGRKGVRITFADKGGGIDRPDLARLFEPFYTTKASASGLGLWVAKQIIESHRGRIRVRSRSKGQQTGTVFSIFLPTENRP